jgi:branched-subunit amino acid transport system permease
MANDARATEFHAIRMDEVHLDETYPLVRIARADLGPRQRLGDLRRQGLDSTHGSIIPDGEISSSSPPSDIGVWRLELLVFVVATAGTGLVAALITAQTPCIQPNAAFSIQWFAAISFMAMIGGLGTIEGPLVGAAVYVVLQDTPGATGEVHLIVLGGVSVIVMLVAPRGSPASSAIASAGHCFRSPAGRRGVAAAV